MSQAGKVLHLYVEVRSVAEEEGQQVGGGNNGSNQLMLQGPDVLPQSKRSPSQSTRAGGSPQPQARNRNHSPTPSKSSSRHSVSFQHHSPEAAGSPTQLPQQNLPYESLDELLEVLNPGATNPVHNSLFAQAHSSDHDPYQGRTLLYTPPLSSARLNVTPSSRPRSCDAHGVDAEDGRKSVVTFSYVKKASVRNMDGSCKPAGQREPGNPFNRLEESPHSDSLWNDCWQATDGHGPSQLYPPQGHSLENSVNSPYWRRATLDSVAREATERALEGFGSPEIRCRLENHGPGNRSPSLPRHYQSPRCQSWAGSPVLSRSVRTLPPNAQLRDPEPGGYRGYVNGLPRSPASDQLSAEARFTYSAGPVSTISHYPPPHSQHRPWLGDESPRLSSKFRPPLPAGKPTDIQHEIPASTHYRTSQHANNSTRQYVHICNSRKADSNTSDNRHYNTSDSQCLHSRALYKLPCSSSKAGDVISPQTMSRSVSPATSPELARRLAVEASQLSTVFMDRRTPSPTLYQVDANWSDNARNGTVTPRESQLYATLHKHRSTEQPPLPNDNQMDRPVPDGQLKGISPLPAQTGLFAPASPACPARLHRVAASLSPTLDPRLQHSRSSGADSPSHHRQQPPQYRGERGPSCASENRQNQPTSERPRVSSQVPPCVLSGQSVDSQTLAWTCQYSQWMEDESIPDRDQRISRSHGQSSNRVPSQYRQDDQRNNEGAVSRVGGVMLGLGVPLVNEPRVEEHSGATGTSSQSSSGVTGSLGRGSLSLPEREDCLSTETSSQRSYDTGDTGSGLQSDSGSVSEPASRSQKIAQAKWEFLFGTSAEERGGTKEGPDTTHTNGSLTHLPSPSLHLKVTNQQSGRGSELSHHKVKQIEVELVTLVPRGSDPNTGIIRRSIKYSETDLDAVPLRCYRETDLDEVMRAEAEQELEEDSAFGSNRSILGTSASSDCPTESFLRGRVEEAEGEENEDERDQREEEEEVASWASVRMQGDMKRQRATKEEDEVYGLRLRRPRESLSDSNTPLKSPVSVHNPCRASESNLDTFSRHFESIVESHRAMGTSYSSLDSVDLLTSGAAPIFTFDLPTLTPEIQSQISESARQIMELSFAPLAKADSADKSETSRSELALPAAVSSLGGGSKDDSAPRVRPMWERESWRRANAKDNFHKAMSAPSLHCSPRERSVHRPVELLYPQDDVAERLALGSNDALANGTKADLQAAKRLAKRLFNLDGFKKSDVARHLSKNNDFSRMVAEEYLTNFNFNGLTIDQALRAFLREFALMGETQERERVLSIFSRRYMQCNPGAVPSQDSIHTLTCAVMLLNTDLHGPNIGKRMSCGQFVSNLEGLNDGKDFPKELLKALYSSIKNEKLQWTIDEEELRKSMSELADVRTDSASHTMKRVGSGGNPLVGVAQQSDAELYKEGFLVRKVHADPDGKRTPRGKRSWKSFYVLLKGLVLYLQKGEYGSDRQLSDEDLKNAVSIHHSLAMRAADYSKRPNVFYLRTADWRVFLFQAPSAEHMQSWITRINAVAAMFSAPPFPAAIGSQKRFSRPLLPGSSTKLSQEEQVKSHENRFRAVSSELADLTATTPDRKVKGRELEEQKLRHEYLEFEKTRYGTYAMLLQAKLRGSGEESLSAFEARLLEDSGLQRARSSPTLPQDSSSSQSSSVRDKSRGSKSSGTGRDGSRKKKSDGQRAEPRRQSSKQASAQEEAEP